MFLFFQVMTSEAVSTSKKPMPRFVHRSMVIETVQPIRLRIKKFSQVESSGRYSCTVLQQGTSNWILEVQACGDSVEVYLRRGSSTCEEQFVEVQLTINDWMDSPFGLRSGRKSLTFRGPTDFQNVVSFKKSLFNRLMFLSQDTLTIQGELTVYREVEEVLESEGEFQARSEKLRKIGRILMLFCFICLCLFSVYHSVLAVYQFTLDVIIPALKIFLTGCCLLMLAALMVYDTVESYRKRRTNGSARVHGRSNNMSLVHAQNRSAVHTHQWRAYSPVRQDGHSRFMRNRRMGAYDQANKRYYVYEESYSY